MEGAARADALGQRERGGLANLKTILAKPFGAQVLADNIRRYWPGSNAA